MWVKICGIQSMNAAVAAYEAGADAVGFILAPSRRRLDPDQVERLIQGLPGHIEKVGVFINERPEEIQRIARQTGLTAIQLHGEEPPALIAQIEFPVIKALRIKGPEDLAGLGAYRAAAALLLDPFVDGQHGGTGKTLDWSLARHAAQVLRSTGVQLSDPQGPLTPGRPKLILAGGLTPQNVAEAIRQGLPCGVDVSSGVETAGKKDLDKIYQFVDQAKEAQV